MTRKIKQYLFALGLKPLWNLIKYGILGFFHLWVGIKKLFRLFGIPAIIVAYDMNKLSNIESKVILPFKKPSFPILPMFKGRESVPHYDHTVYTISQGRLFGTYTIATHSNIILRDVTWWHNLDKGTNPYSYYILPLDIEKISGTVGILTGNDTDKNYHHWITTIIPKYYILQKSWIKIDKFIADTNSGFHQEWWAALGLTPDQIITPDASKYYEFDKLVCTNDTTIYGNIQPWVKDYLWETFLDQNDTSPANRKIYVKRISNRKIANEQEFEEYISSQGFEIHTMEGMTIRKQAELFHQASVIISPHGAGLTNIVFSKPGTQVIEIFHPETIFGHYYTMAGSLWMPYHPILGTTKSDPKLIEMDQDMIVNMEDVKAVIESL